MPKSFYQFRHCEKKQSDVYSYKARFGGKPLKSIMIESKLKFKIWFNFMFKLFKELFASQYPTSICSMAILLSGCINVSVAYGWTTNEHKEMVPYRQDYNLADAQFKVGKGNNFTNNKDQWNYHHLLVAADFFQNWSDFQATGRDKLIITRKVIDHGDEFKNANHD